MGISVTLRGGSGDMLKSTYDSDLDDRFEFPQIPSGMDVFWTIRTSAADNNWLSVTYGNGLYVAVANTGTGNRVMTSPDGITWTIRTSAADNNWYSVTYGNGLYVAIGASGTGNRVMTSPDGITWTIRTSAADNVWYSVTYGNGLYVAIGASGTGNRVMTLSVVEITDPKCLGFGKKYVIDNNLLRVHDAASNTAATAYAKVKTITLDKLEPTPSTFRIKFDIHCTTGIQVRGKIYKNGVALGTERNTNSNTFVTFSEDLAFALGDTIELWVYTTNGANPVHYQNLRIYGSESQMTIDEAIKAGTAGLVNPVEVSNT